MFIYDLPTQGLHLYLTKRVSLFLFVFNSWFYVDLQLLARDVNCHPSICLKCSRFSFIESPFFKRNPPLALSSAPLQVFYPAVKIMIRFTFLVLLSLCLPFNQIHLLSYQNISLSNFLSVNKGNSLSLFMMKISLVCLLILLQSAKVF